MRSSDKLPRKARKRKIGPADCPVGGEAAHWLIALCGVRKERIIMTVPEAGDSLIPAIAVEADRRCLWRPRAASTEPAQPVEHLAQQFDRRSLVWTRVPWPRGRRGTRRQALGRLFRCRDCRRGDCLSGDRRRGGADTRTADAGNADTGTADAGNASA